MRLWVSPRVIPGRIPDPLKPKWRLDPIRLRESRDGLAFQEMVRQLLGGALAVAFPGKGRVAWPKSAISPGAPNDSAFVMDWVTWHDKTFDTSASPRPLFLNVESTISNLKTNPVYIARKIHIIRQLVEAPDGIAGCVSRLKVNTTYGAFPDLSGEPDVFLLLASNSTEQLPDAEVLGETLRKGTGGFENSDRGYHCEPVSGSSGLKISFPGGSGLCVGLIERLRLVELAALVRALDWAKRHLDLDDRFLFELTNLTGDPRLLRPMPDRHEVEEVTPGINIQVDGKAVMFQRFAIDPLVLMRLCTVLRLVTDYAYLQRLPDGAHLEAMAMEVSSGGRFPTPVLCIPSQDVTIDSRGSVITQKGGAPLPPYQWHLVDGQHRAFCYYLVDPGKHLQTIDVNCYILTNEADKAAVSSALFLNVNYKAIKPPIDLALSHHALASSWPRASWVCRKSSRDCPHHDSQLYSSRVLATRFLLELNGKSTVFKEFFKLAGAKDPGKSSVQSLSTYLSPDFEIRNPDDRNNPIAARFGTVKGASQFWKVRDPPPEALVRVWPTLVQEFDSFVRTVAGPADPDGEPTNASNLKQMVHRNINVFVALWRVFYTYRLKQAQMDVKYTWPVPAHRAHAMMTELIRLQRGHFLYGKKGAYRSGGGVTKLTALMIKKFNEAKSGDEPLLANAK